MSALLQSTALSTIQDLARQPTQKPAAKAAPQAQSDGKLTAPDWWIKLPPDGRDAYLRNHPASKMTPFLRQELKDHLTKHPEERKLLRRVIKQIASDPDKFLKDDFDKLNKAAKKPVSKKQKKDIVDAVDKANKTGKSHSILKAVVTVMAVAGVLTLGAGLIAAGGLPYMIIGPRLVKDTIGLVKDINSRVKQGQDVVSSCFHAVGTAISRAASDPQMLAAALMLQNQHAQRNADKEAKKQQAKDKKYSAQNAKPTSKRQSAPPKKEKVVKPAPKVKPHNSNAVS